MIKETKLRPQVVDLCLGAFLCRPAEVCAHGHHLLKGRQWAAKRTVRRRGKTWNGFDTGTCQRALPVSG